MSFLAKSKGEVTYKDLTGFHKWFLIILISMGSSIIYTPMYLKNVFYEPLMQGLGCTNADLGAMVSFYGIAAVIFYLPSGVLADKFRMRTLATWGFLGTAILTFVYATLPSVTMCYVLFGGMGITSILIWWGTRFKVIRLCCEEDEYPTKIGISYSIYGAVGLVVGLINAAIVAAIPVPAQGIQAVLILLGAIIALLGILSYIFMPDFKGEVNKDAKGFSVADAMEAVKTPGVIWACLAYFCVYTVYQGATYTTPYLTSLGTDSNLVNVARPHPYLRYRPARRPRARRHRRSHQEHQDHHGLLGSCSGHPGRVHRAAARSRHGHHRRLPGRRVRLRHLRCFLHRLLAAVRAGHSHAHLRHRRRSAVRHRLLPGHLHPYLVRRYDRRFRRRCLQHDLRESRLSSQLPASSSSSCACAP